VNDVAQIKAAARKTAFAARKVAFMAGQGQAAELLADYLAAHHGKVLSAYMPILSEINPLLAMRTHQGPVCVPVIMGVGQALRFREWTPDCAMVTGEFGALIPQEGAWLEPEILIVPLVAFDRRGYRMGYGGGFYDRTLQALRARRRTLAIGFAFAGQEMRAIPIDATDEPLDAIITELGLITLVEG
jgi:5-formyltetrahydrofolate cyclo-ligase